MSTKQHPRPTIAAIRKAVLAEPDMGTYDLMDELVAAVKDDNDSAQVEARFDALYWAVDRAREIRPEQIA